MQGERNALGIVGPGQLGVPADELIGRQTILDAIRGRFPGADIQHAPGSTIHTGTDEAIAEAVAAARASEVAIVVLGERSGLTEDSTTGEFRDRRDLGFVGRQQELLEAVVATGTPVVLVVVSGRPLALEWAARHCPAIVLAWVPGDHGPEAIADVLTGVVSPGGKLPISIPRHVGQVPITYRHHPSGGRSQWKGDYVDGPTAPLWPFGHGLSYTTFALSDLRLDRSEVATEDGRLTVRVDVSNVGGRSGDEVVQLYARDEEASVARPVLELCGFQRVTLEPGERRTVTFRLSAEQLSYTAIDLRRVVEPGRVTLHVGTSSVDLPLSAEVTLTGPTVTIAARRRYVTETSIA
jgi:beta-glucosidase